MIGFLTQVVLALAELWNIANFWARWAIRVIILWPLALLGVALFGYPFPTAIAALVPFAAIVIFFLSFRDPLILPIIAALNVGEYILKWVAVIAGLDMLMGLYLGLVPIANDRSLVVYFILAWGGILFFSLARVLGARARLIGTAISVCVLIIVVITVIWLSGGREGIQRRSALAKQQELVQQARQRAAREKAQRDQQNQRTWAAVAAASKLPISPNASFRVSRPTIVEESESREGRLVAATVSVDGTNEWASDNANRYHKTDLVLEPGEKIWAQVLNPEVRLGFTTCEGRDCSTTIWGKRATYHSDFDGGPDDPMFGWDFYGTLFVALLPELKPDARPVVAASFLPNASVVVGQNRSDKRVRVVLHRNLVRRHQSITTGEIKQDGYGYSALANPHGPDGEPHQKNLDRWLVRLRIVQEPLAATPAEPKVPDEEIPSPDLKRRQPVQPPVVEPSRPSPFPKQPGPPPKTKQAPLPKAQAATPKFFDSKFKATLGLPRVAFLIFPFCVMSSRQRSVQSG